MHRRLFCPVGEKSEKSGNAFGVIKVWIVDHSRTTGQVDAADGFHVQLVIAVHRHGGDGQEGCRDRVQRKRQTGGVVIAGADDARAEALLLAGGEQLGIWPGKARFVQQAQRQILQIGNIDRISLRETVKSAVNDQTERIIR